MAYNKSKYQREYHRRLKAEYRAWYNEIKNKPCTDCNLFWPPYVMQFDHLPGFEKSYEVGRMVIDKMNKELILAEIAKCELVCSNCHAIRTHIRRPRA